jgi:mannose-6-phosphate isomerase-like protein (cupin superfamily)
MAGMDKLPVDISTAERFLLGTDEMTVLTTSAQTDGAIFAVTVRMPPGGGPPMMHRHDPGEVYHVLEGRFTFYVGDPGDRVERITATAGQVVPLAGRTPHTVRNETDRDAVAFVVHAPGPPMEQFCRAAADLARRGDVDMTTVLGLAHQHGIEMLGPVPAGVA